MKQKQRTKHDTSCLVQNLAIRETKSIIVKIYLFYHFIYWLSTHTTELNSIFTMTSKLNDITRVTNNEKNGEWR